MRQSLGGVVQGDVDKLPARIDGHVAGSSGRNRAEIQRLDLLRGHKIDDQQCGIAAAERVGVPAPGIHDETVRRRTGLDGSDHGAALGVDDSKVKRTISIGWKPNSI